MIYETIITGSAELDIAEAVRYVAKELQNLSAANRLLDDIETAVASLEKMPKRHSLVKNVALAKNGFRFLPVHNYLVFYIVRDDKHSATIERFLHSRRDWGNIIGQ